MEEQLELHLQTISFRIIHYTCFLNCLNWQIWVTISETFQLKGNSDIASIFPCFSSASALNLNLLLLSPGRKSLQKIPQHNQMALDSLLPDQSLSQMTRDKEVAATSGNWRKETLRWCWERAKEVFLSSVIMSFITNS